MPINVSEALDLDTGEIVSVEREDSGSFVDGLWTPAGSPITFKSLISVQQPTGQQLLVLDESERVKDVRLFISNKPLRGASDNPRVTADVINYQGLKFRIIDLGDWNAFGHTTALGVRDV